MTISRHGALSGSGSHLWTSQRFLALHHDAQHDRIWTFGGRSNHWGLPYQQREGFNREYPKQPSWNAWFKRENSMVIWGSEWFKSSFAHQNALSAKKGRAWTTRQQEVQGCDLLLQLNRLKSIKSCGGSVGLGWGYVNVDLEATPSPHCICTCICWQQQFSLRRTSWTAGRNQCGCFSK